MGEWVGEGGGTWRQTGGGVVASLTPSHGRAGAGARSLVTRGATRVAPRPTSAPL